jgi:prophage regulatory protein
MANIIKLQTVISTTGLSRSTIYALVAKRSFPQPVKLTERAVGWLDSEIQEWIEFQAARRDGQIGGGL